MNKTLQTLIVLTGSVLLSACSLLGAPDSATIEKVARQQMAASLANPSMDPAAKAELNKALEAAKISHHGMCNSTDKKDVHACMVDVTIKMPGAAEETKQTFIVELTKGADGNWKAVE